MHSSTEKIIENLLDKVDDGKSYYSPAYLRSVGFPAAIAENIQEVLFGKIDEELHFQTAWSDSEHPSLQQLKNALKEQYHEQARIPAEKLKEILDEAVGSTLKVYLQPRKYLSEVIFQEDKELNYDELVKRAGKLSVYKHFGQAIPRYMKKRDLNTLTKERCHQLIEKLDSNLIKTYEAEDWARVLDLLRKLGDGKISARLAAVFFEDKAMNEVADALKNTPENELSRDRLIEIIAQPSTVKKQKETEEEGAASIAESSEPMTAITEKQDEVIEESTLVDRFSEEWVEEEPEEEEEDENSFNRMFSKEQSDKPIFQEFEEDIEVEEDLAKAVEETEHESEPEKETFDQGQIAFSEEEEKEEQQNDEVKSTYQERESLKEDVEEEAVKEEDELNSWVTGDDDTGEELFGFEEENTEEEDEPIWQQFMSPEEKEALKREEESEEDEIITEEHIFAEGHEDVAAEEKAIPAEEENAQLKNYLLDKESTFINELYKGNRKEYDESLSKLEQQKSWKEASDFLENDVFSAHQVDMFSEAAIDYTDRLQSYFDEYKS